MDKKEDKKNKKATPKKAKTAPRPKFLDLAIAALNERTHNEYMPYFILNPEDKTNNVFAHLFIAKHCRNAYAGLFIRLEDNPGKALNDKERAWVSAFRQKGYGCVVATSIPHFKKCVESYKHTAGTMGYNHFYATFERSHI